MGGGTTWGWYSVDPELNLIYYGTGNPGHLEPGAAPRRQPLVDDDLRPRRRHRHGEVGLPDDAPRRVGLRRRQRDDPRRHPGEGRADQGAGPLRPQRLRLHPEPRDRRAPGRREVRPGGELGDPRRHGDRAGRRWCRATRPAANGEDVNTTNICPAALGTKDQQPAAFSPKTGLFYVPTNHVCMDYEPYQVSYTAGQPYVGATVAMYPAPGGTRPRQLHRLGRQRGQDRLVQLPSRSRSGRAPWPPRATSCSTARSRAT